MASANWIGEWTLTRDQNFWTIRSARARLNQGADVLTRSVRLGGPVSDPSTVWPSSGAAAVDERRRMPDRPDRRIPAAGVLLASAALAVLVFSLTRDPVRSLGVIYVAGLLIFVLQEAHDAWNDPSAEAGGPRTP